jgi:competence protein ComEA
MVRQTIYVLVGILAGFVLAGIIFTVARVPGGRPVTLDAPSTEAPLEVHVVGAVLRPGVYVLLEGSRVQDAISAAGGFSVAADLNALNLAAKLEDGQQLDVPYLSGAASTAVPTTSFRVLPAGATATPSDELININTASTEELETLPGIGPTIAQNIATYRSAHGPFAHIEDIMNVAGIGPATFDNIKDLITQ